jgi:hypothetical protein
MHDDAVYSGSLVVGMRLRRWQALTVALIMAALRHRNLEARPLLGGQEPACGPDLVGRPVFESPRTTGRFALGQGGLDVGARACAGLAGLFCLLLSPLFQRADAGFDGAIIGQLTRR